jgi:hypothetical protein
MSDENITPANPGNTPADPTTPIPSTDPTPAASGTDATAETAPGGQGVADAPAPPQDAPASAQSVPDASARPAPGAAAEQSVPGTDGAPAAAAHGAEGVPQAAGGQVPPPGYGQYPQQPGYPRYAYGEAPSSVRGDVKRLFKHRVVQFVGAGLIGFVVGGGVVATIGAFVWDHDSGPRWQDRGSISQQWGGGFGPGSSNGTGSGNGSGSNGNSGSGNGSDNGGILVTP